MKTTLFLGAGASVFASQPTTKELLKRLRDRVQERKNDPNRNSVLQAYAEWIVDANAYDDVESLYDGLQTMIDTHDNANCEPITEKIRYHYDKKRTITHKEMANELIDLKSTIRGILLDSFKIKRNNSKQIVLMYDTIRSIIEKNGAVEFQVLTTNYDLVMETYAKEKGLEVVNGFRHLEDLVNEWADVWKRNEDKHSLYLTKLHGSIHWHKDDGVIMETGATARRDAENDVMIAPTEGIKRYDGEPFSKLMGRFVDVMQDTDVLLVIGFSYRDDEIVRIIKNRLAEGMILISISKDAASDIRRVASEDIKIREISASMGLSSVANSGIILCEQSFGPDTIGDVAIALTRAYELVPQQEDSDAAP